jgi:hypothetical protein
MTLTYVFSVSPASASAFGPSTGAAFGASGKSYTPTAAGIITGVTGSDALLMTGVNANVNLLLATGATADRPSASPAPATSSSSTIPVALNNNNPAPTLGLPFYDTTLSKTVYFVSTSRSPTGYVDQAGNPA